MAGPDEDRFRPKVGRPRQRGNGRQLRFVNRVLGAGNRPLVRPAQRRPGAARLARGGTVSRLIGRGGGRTQRRVAVKLRQVVLADVGARSTITHLAYVERDAVGPDGEPGLAYGPDTDRADTAAFELCGREDRHQFRIIVAPEDGEAIGDLRRYTRDLMAQMETDLGTKFDWVAVDHHDTGHPHTHIVLRGVTDRGLDLVIDREYIAHGMRGRARELATAWLGPRTEREIEATLARDAIADRWTGLDAGLARLAEPDGRVVQEGRDQGALRERLRHLETLGLAEQDGDTWRLSPRHQMTLRSLGEQGDIIRTLQRAMRGTPREVALPGVEGDAAFTGRIAAKGLVDELDERGWLAVDGIDGRAHYVALPKGGDLSSWPVGGIVEMRSGGRATDRAIVAGARDGVFTLGAALPDGVSESGVTRRLEALRRAGLVDRLDAMHWRVPDDLVAAGARHDRAQGRAPILRATLPVGDQVRAIGATWLDQTLTNDPSGIASRGFGAEVLAARDARIGTLETEGLVRRSGARVLLARDLLAQLRRRDLDAAGAGISGETGLTYRPVENGRVSGTYVRTIDRPSGRFAMLDDGAGGFALVPWRPVVEQHLGRSMSAIVQGGNASWEWGRSRGLGL